MVEGEYATGQKGKGKKVKWTRATGEKGKPQKREHGQTENRDKGTGRRRKGMKGKCENAEVERKKGTGNRKKVRRRKGKGRVEQGRKENGKGEKGKRTKKKGRDNGKAIWANLEK